MALVVDDRIKETTTTTNTGSYSLAGAVTGFQSFSDGVGSGNTTYYCCTDGTDYEIGLGTLSGTTLARTTILESSNSNTAVSWSAGSKDIFCTLPASKALIKDASNHVKFADTEKLIFGDGNDAEIYHSGAHTYIQSNGTGNLYIRDQGSGDLKLEGSTYITLQSATNENYLVATANGAVTLYYDALGKVATTSTGIEVFGSTVDNGATHDGDVTFTGTSYNAVWDKSANALEFADNAEATFGTGSDLQIYHNGSNSFIENITGNLYIRQSADDLNVFIQSDNGSGGLTSYFAADGSTGEAQLFHYGSEKLATQSGGIDVTGNITVSGTVDGRDVATDGTKLDGIASGAEVNQNAFSLVAVSGQPTIYADSKTDYLTLASGSNVTITTNATTDTVTIASTDTTYNNATTSADGLMSSSDKTKLDGIEANADVTDATNVQAAGALMDSELTSEASVKAIDQGLATTDSPTFAGLTSNGDIVFEGATADDFETTVTVTDPTADRTITLPDRTGTVLLSDLGDSQTINFQDDITFEDSLNSASADTRFYIKSNNDGVAGVDLTLWKNSDSPAVNDQIGRLNFYGTDTAGAGFQSPYTAIASYIDGYDLSASRHGHIEMQTTVSGSVPVGGSTGTFTSASFHYDRTKIDVGKLQIGADGSSTTFTTDATSDQTITLPDQTGTAILWQNKWPDDPVTTGTYAFRNYAIGENTLSSITTGYNNVVYGREAGASLTTGYRNTAIGEDAFGDASSANNSAAVGERALQGITTGFPNTGFGAAALLDNRSGTNNTAVGYASGRGLTTYGITAVGHEAGSVYTSGAKYYQTLIGNFCGDDTLGDRSTGLGAFAISDGYHTDSVGVGYDALGLTSTVSPWYNVAVGNFAGDGIWAGDHNVAVGYASDAQMSTTNGAVAIGSSAIAPTYGVSIGYLAGNSYAGGSLYNVLVGYRAGRDMDGGDYCVFVGYDAGEQGGTGDRNTGLGATSLDALTTGANNSAVGMNSLSGLTTGSRNSALGEGTGFYLTTGTNNTFLGYQAGFVQDNSTTNALTTGSNVMCLGSEAMPSSATATNEITLGDNNISSLRCNVQTISSLSDERDKTAIEDLSYGLDFINDMRPVQFTWNRRDGSIGAKPDIGFIAQDLYEVELDHSSSSRTRLVNWSDPNKLEADYVRSYPILVKAVQELSAKCNALEARLAALEGA